MDMMKAINAQMKADRQDKLAASPQLTLGELILNLEAIGDKSKPLALDFGAFPEKVGSWRGIYAELSIRYGANPTSVSYFLENLKDAVGKEFTGWKGGEFTMSRQTPMWVANSGESGISGYKDGADSYPSVGVVGVLDGDKVTITTEAMECY